MSEDVRQLVPEQGPTHVSNTALWQSACESLMAGAFHSIGSRVSALSGIATMAEMGQALDGALLSLLEDEVEHLTDLLEATRTLPRASGTAAGPTRMSALVPRVLRLVELSLDARGLELRYDGPDEGVDVELDRTSVAHSLSALLVCVCWRAHSAGADTLALSLSTDGGEVEFRAELGVEKETPPGDERTPPDVPPTWVIREGLESIASLLGDAGGSLVLGEGTPPSGFRYRLPKLSLD